MRAFLLTLALLGTVAFSFATLLEPWFQSWQGNRAKSGNLLQTALGDGRHLFASHFYAKADAYFHNGYYPTIFDNRAGYAKAHIAEDAHEGEEAENFLGKPRDWLDRFGRSFFPARHTHLGDAGCGHSCCQRSKDHEGHDDDCDHKDHEAGQHLARKSDEREILPWLRLSAELDPQRIETYVVTSYWLRGALKQVDEAERFLRYGLQQNPGEPELLFELGRIYSENRNDTGRARNVWELAVRKWDERESGKKEPNIFLRAQLLGQLAKLEEAEKNYPRALEHLTLLKAISPNKEGIQKWRDEVKGKQ